MRLIRISDDRWIYVRSHHHILLDAWCLPLLLVDFLAYYEACVRGEPLPNKKVTPYREYIAWLGRQDMVSAEHFWRNALRGFDTPAYLAGSRRAVSIPQVEPTVADEIAHLSRDDTTALHELARRYKLTPFTFMQAAWAVLMNRYTNRREVLFGVTVAGRPAEIDQVEEMAGLFINTLPLRVGVEPNALLLDWLHELLTLGLEMRQFDYAPLVNMQKWSDVEPGKALFDSFVVFENVPVNQSLQRAHMPLDIVSYESRTHSNYPLNLTIRPGDELRLKLTYDRGLFDAPTVARMLGHYITLLESMIRNPQGRLCDLPMLPESEHKQLLHTWNQTENFYPEPRDVV
ncbi:MAG: condensation domain-containing protein, partial [Nitrososphaera sp.]